MPHWGYGPGFDHLGIAGWLWILGQIAFWVLVVLLILLGVRWLLRADRGGSSSGSAPGLPPVAAPPPAAPPAPRPDDPLEILRQRYARGEIDDEEYERRRKILSGG